MPKIKSVKSVGQGKTRDLEVKHDDHQFYMSNGILSSNSHAVGYSVVSYQCAFLSHYYPVEWATAFLNKESDNLEKAISIVQKNGFVIKEVDINTSGDRWEPLGKNNIVQPLTAIKGLGKKSVGAIMRERPISSLDELFFGDKFQRSELNKRAKSLLIKSGAIDSLMVGVAQIGNKRHLSEVIGEFDGKLDNFQELLKKLEEIEPPKYSYGEKLDDIFSLTGVFPSYMIFTDEVKEEMESKGILSLTQFVDLYNEFKEDENINDNNWKNLAIWFILRDYEVKKTKSGKKYIRISMTDNEGMSRYMNIWNADSDTELKLYRYGLYAAKVKYDENWGFSITSNKQFVRVR